MEVCFKTIAAAETVVEAAEIRINLRLTRSDDRNPSQVISELRRNHNNREGCMHGFDFLCKPYNKTP